MKQRLDILVVERGLAPTRAKAQALIMAGKLLVNGEKITKSGQMVAEDAEIELLEKDHPWVSRGGVKLAHALTYFGVNPEGKICLDVGASTGGFTDVLLQNGAAKVYAVDVGHGQFDWKLRNDPRVAVFEKTNARYLTREQIPDPIDLIVCDASFISLMTILPACLSLCHPAFIAGSKETDPASPLRSVRDDNCALIALIKPQFEAGREKVGKGGVVKDPEVHQEVCKTITEWLEQEMRWNVLGLTESPIKGPKGNVEFLIAARST